jgi:NADH dehydrogenase (ubiquinone) 1 alpha/beta subcomplex 1, acyl-carrier protein
MFRSAIVRSLRASVPRAAVKTPAPFQIRSSPIALRAPQFTPCFVSQGVRCYSAPAGLNKTEVEGRIVNLLKNFDKVCWGFFFPPSFSLCPTM